MISDTIIKVNIVTHNEKGKAMLFSESYVMPLVIEILSSSQSIPITKSQKHNRSQHLKQHPNHWEVPKLAQLIKTIVSPMEGASFDFISPLLEDN